MAPAIANVLAYFIPCGTAMLRSKTTPLKQRSQWWFLTPLPGVLYTQSTVLMKRENESRYSQWQCVIVTNLVVCLHCWGEQESISKIWGCCQQKYKQNDKEASWIYDLTCPLLQPAYFLSYGEDRYVQHVKVMDALQNFFFVQKLHICWNLQPFHWAPAELALLGIKNLLSINKLNEWIKHVLGRAQGFTGEMQSSPAAAWLRPRGSFSFLRFYKNSSLS